MAEAEYLFEEILSNIETDYYSEYESESDGHQTPVENSDPPEKPPVEEAFYRIYNASEEYKPKVAGI